ncbi:MFS transporter [Actinokineospora sp. 24-640]
MKARADTSVPLSRNRDYRLLWIGQGLSEVGIGASTVALPLLVLAITGSAAASGLVLAAHAAAQLVAGIPAGVLVDRWNRRRVMLLCEAVQAVTVAGIALAAFSGTASLPLLLVLAAVLGLCQALFEPAEASTLPALVGPAQLPTAIALNAARGYVGLLAGTAIGGALFAARRWAPFGLQALAHAASFGLLLFLRIPDREPGPVVRPNFRRELTEGLRWVWQDRHIRAVTGCAIGLNFFFQAFYLIVLALVAGRGAPPGEIGLMAAMLGVGGVLGALVAPRLHRALSPRMAILGTMWVIAALMPFAAIAPNTYAVGALLAAAAFLAPTASTTITTYQLLRTPENLRGRMAATMAVTIGVAAVAGPATGGLLADAINPTHAVLACAAGTALLSLLFTLTPALRSFPKSP